MKNRVLRLAIVAILVVAMVLSMAACGKKPVETQAPTTQAPKTQEPVAPATKAPEPEATVAPEVTPAPVVNTDEADLEAKYGIVFEVKDDLAVDYDGIDLKPITFTANDEDVTDLYNAIGASSVTVAAKKVIGIAEDGGKITTTKATNAGVDTVTATKAGTYTVTWVVDVTYEGSNMGFFTSDEIDESYTFTKTYTVAKKDIEFGMVDKATTVGTAVDKSFKYTLGDATGSSIEELVENTPFADLFYADTAVTDAYKPYADISVEMAKEGTNVVPFAINDGDKEVVTEIDSDLTLNFNFIFNDGKVYVLSAADKAKADNAIDSIREVANGTTFKDGTSTERQNLEIENYEALSEAIQFVVKENDAAKTLIAGFDQMKYDLGRQGLVDEAKELQDAVIKLDNQASKDALVSYILGLSTEETTGVNKLSDKAFVYGKLDTDADDAEVNSLAQDLTEAHEEKLAVAYANAVNAYYGAVDTYETSRLAKDLATVKTKLDAVATAQAALIDKDVTITTIATYKTFTDDTTNNSITNIPDDTDNNVQAMKSGKVLSTIQGDYAEMAVRQEAYDSLVAGLDAYVYATGKSKNSIPEIQLLTSFNFLNTAKAFKADVTAIEGITSANALIFAKTGTVYNTPVYFLQDVVDAQQAVIDAYVAFDTKIADTQATIKDLLASKMVQALKAFDSSYVTEDAMGMNDGVVTMVAEPEDGTYASTVYEFIVAYVKAAANTAEANGTDPAKLTAINAEDTADVIIAEIFETIDETIAEWVEEFKDVADKAADPA